MKITKNPRKVNLNIEKNRDLKALALDELKDKNIEISGLQRSK